MLHQATKAAVFEHPPPPEPLDGVELAELGHLNLAEFVRHMARYGGSILEEDGLLLAAGEHPHPGPYRNCLIRLNSRLSAREVLERGREFFGSRGRSYVLWARVGSDDDLVTLCRLERMELLEEAGLPELYLNERPQPLRVPDGVRLVTVRESSEKTDFLAVNIEGWGMAEMPFELAAAAFFHPDSVVGPNVLALLAYHDDIPLSAAMVLVSHGVAGGYWGATSRRGLRRWLGKLRQEGGGEESRRVSGGGSLADLCLRTAMNAGFELGGRRFVGQASGSGEPIWGRMGCRPMTRYYRFLGRSAATSTWE